MDIETFFVRCPVINTNTFRKILVESEPQGPFPSIFSFPSPTTTILLQDRSNTYRTHIHHRIKMNTTTFDAFTLNQGTSSEDESTTFNKVQKSPRRGRRRVVSHRSDSERGLTTSDEESFSPRRSSRRPWSRQNSPVSLKKKGPRKDESSPIKKKKSKLRISVKGVPSDDNIQEEVLQTLSKLRKSGVKKTQSEHFRNQTDDEVEAPNVDRSQSGRPKINRRSSMGSMVNGVWCPAFENADFVTEDESQTSPFVLEETKASPFKSPKQTSSRRRLSSRVGSGSERHLKNGGPSSPSRRSASLRRRSSLRDMNSSHNHDVGGIPSESSRGKMKMVLAGSRNRTPSRRRCGGASSEDEADFAEPVPCTPRRRSTVRHSGETTPRTPLQREVSQKTMTDPFTPSSQVFATTTPKQKSRPQVEADFAPPVPCTPRTRVSQRNLGEDSPRTPSERQKSRKDATDFFTTSQAFAASPRQKSKMQQDGSGKSPKQKSSNRRTRRNETTSPRRDGLSMRVSDEAASSLENLFATAQQPTAEDTVCAIDAMDAPEVPFSGTHDDDTATGPSNKTRRGRSMSMSSVDSFFGPSDPFVALASSRRPLEKESSLRRVSRQSSSNAKPRCRQRSSSFDGEFFTPDVSFTSGTNHLKRSSSCERISIPSRPQGTIETSDEKLRARNQRVAQIMENGYKSQVMRDKTAKKVDPTWKRRLQRGDPVPAMADEACTQHDPFDAERSFRASPSSRRLQRAGSVPDLERPPDLVPGHYHHRMF